MGTRLRSWWQLIKQHRVAILVVASILVVVVALIVVGYSIDWTGFNGYAIITTTQTIKGISPPTVTRTVANQPGKTLWDWLQLLFIPAILTLGAVWFTSRQNHDHKIALDNQHEVALQAYIDNMSELLLEKNLRSSNSDNEVQNIATARTLIVLPNLDPQRKRSVIKFLHDAGLITKDEAIIDLMEADLSGADLGEDKFRALNLFESALNFVDLMGANLRGTNLKKSSLISSVLYAANLREADLSEATLFMTNFVKADLRKAKLVDADLTGAWLMQTDLREADLSNAHIHNANLREADLSLAKMERADLTEASLIGAKVTKEQLETVKSLKGATMPDGSIHP